MEGKDLFLNHIAQTTPHPVLLDVDRAKGSYIFTKNGHKYLDLIAGIGVTVTGHLHPFVVSRLTEQINKHLHVMVYGEFVQDSVNDLTKKLLNKLPEQLNTIYYTNSGTEANEGALKLAKRYTGRTDIISFKHSYHGSTHGSLSVTGNETKKYAFRPLLPKVKFIDFNKISQLKEITEKTASVIIETVQGDAGVRIPSIEFMKELRKACSDHGALLIADEIQVGIGRTGTFFAFEQFDIVPDILTLGKALGGGLPLAAFVANKKIMDSFTFNPMLGHITTFGGNPVSCAAACGVMEVFEKENILDFVESKGKLFSQLLKHRKIKEIRRIGLMLAVELDTHEEVKKVVDYCLEHGVILFWFLSTNNSFRIAPPLTIDDSEIKEGCAVIRDALNTL